MKNLVTTVLLTMLFCAGSALAEPAGKPDPLAEISVSHVCFVTHDYDRLMAFYQDVFGFEIDAEWEAPGVVPGARLSYLTHPSGMQVEIVGDPKLAPPQPPAEIADDFGVLGYRHVCFNVPDVDAAYAAAVERGAEAFVEPFDFPKLQKRLAFVRDPDGNAIEFVMPMQQTDAKPETIGAHADTGLDLADWQQRLAGYFAAWSFYGGAPTPADLTDAKTLYTADTDAIYIDPLPPLLGYQGWTDFERVTTQVWKDAGITDADIRYDGRPRVYRLADNLVYTTCLAEAEVQTTGGVRNIEQRGTQVWQRESDGIWRIQHEHFSPVVTGEPFLTDDPLAADYEGDAEFGEVLRQFADLWQTQDGTVNWQAAEAMYDQDSARIHFVPWPPRAGYVGFDAFRKGVAATAFKNLATLDFEVGPVHATRRDTPGGTVAWTVNPVALRITRTTGEDIRAHGRQTMI